MTYIVHGPMDWAPRLVSFLSFRLPATADRSAYGRDAVVDQPSVLPPSRDGAQCLALAYCRVRVLCAVP